MATVPSRLTQPVRDGERMDRDEFKARCEAMPPHTRAELVNGVVFMPAATRLIGHGAEHFRFITWLGVYEAGTPGVIGGDAVSVDLGEVDFPQPDGVLFIDPACGGVVQVINDYVVGPPELLGEISGSTVDHDLGVKRTLYHRNHVREYIVWRTEDRAIDWFVWRPGQYAQLPPDEAGIIRSRVFPGLWLDVPAMIRGDRVQVHRVLQQGLASPEHASFLGGLTTRE